MSYGVYFIYINAVFTYISLALLFLKNIPSFKKHTVDCPTLKTKPQKAPPYTVTVGAGTGALSQADKYSLFICLESVFTLGTAAQSRTHNQLKSEQN